MLRAEGGTHVPPLSPVQAQSGGGVGLSAGEIAGQILEASGRSRSKECKSFRFSEAGDFRDQEDVEKMAEVCRILSEHGIRCYGYTARKDLDLEPLMAHATVQGSGFMASNEFRLISDPAKWKGPVCPGDCRKCRMCQSARGRVIGVLAH